MVDKGEALNGGTGRGRWGGGGGWGLGVSQYVAQTWGDDGSGAFKEKGKHTSFLSGKGHTYLAHLL